MKIQFYKSKKNRKWYWRAVANNGRKVGGGTQGYTSKAGCVKGFNVFIKAIQSGKIECE
jgi:uncharacterized protein YegP (UPF0339 family)